MRALFVVLGLLFLALAAWLFARRLVVLARGVTVRGRVVAHEARDNDDSPSYLPVVAFADAEGREHRFTSVAGGAARRPPVGDAVEVRYLPANPKLAYIATFLHMWAAPFALTVLGVVFMSVYWDR